MIADPVTNIKEDSSHVILMPDNNPIYIVYSILYIFIGRILYHKSKQIKQTHIISVFILSANYYV